MISRKLDLRLGLRMGKKSSNFAPTDVDGLVLWLKADSITGLNDGDAVGTWEDESGEGNDATQGTASKKPTYKTNIQNGKPVVRFDGSDDYMEVAGLTVNAGTVFTVIRLNSDQKGETITNWTSANNGFRCQYRTVPDMRGFFSKNAYTDVVSVEMLNKWKIVCLRNSGTAAEMIINGTEYSADSENLTDTAGYTTWHIGKYRLSDANFWYGDFAEVIIYNSALSNSDYQSVEDYLSDRWDITI